MIPPSAFLVWTNSIRPCLCQARRYRLEGDRLGIFADHEMFIISPGDSVLQVADRAGSEIKIFTADGEAAEGCGSIRRANCRI